VSALPRDEYASTPSGVEVLAGESRWADAAPSPSGDHDFHLAPPQLVEVMCECGQSNCTGNIVLSLKEYEAVRLHPMHFLVKEGHQVADVVRVVGYGTEYVVVAKFEADAFSAIGGL
jgi:hypothetical protein